MNGTSLATKGMICRGSTPMISGGGGGIREIEVPILKPHINVLKINTKISKNAKALQELQNIKFEVQKILTSY